MPGTYHVAMLPCLPPELAQSLIPFISVFDQFIVPATKYSPRRKHNSQHVTQTARRIDKFLHTALHHPVHPAITTYALRLCCHVYVAHSNAIQPLAARRRAFKQLDRAYTLVVALGQHYGTDELLLLDL